MQNTLRYSPTYRQTVKIPDMPTSCDELNKLPTVSMPKAMIVDNRLVFSKAEEFSSALELGFFLIRIPDDFDLTPGDLFVRNFFKPRNSLDDNYYTGYKDIKIDAPYQGYFDREFDQWENYYIESAHWEKTLPPPLCLLGQKMATLGISILKNIFIHLKIPEKLWGTITSDLSKMQGHQMLAFNHFRSEKPTRGSKFHRDSGWVTILRSTEPGLVALIGDRLYAVNPENGYFIVNFGSSIEILTALLPTPVRANIHGVVRTNKRNNLEGRTSYTIFLDSNLKGDIYQLESPDKARIIQTVADFAVQEVQRTYDNDNINL